MHVVQMHAVQLANSHLKCIVLIYRVCVLRGGGGQVGIDITCSALVIGREGGMHILYIYNYINTLPHILGESPSKASISRKR